MSYYSEAADDELIQSIIAVAIDVQSTLGVGFNEEAYRNALCIGLEDEGLAIESEREVSLHYKGKDLGRRYADIVVDDEVVLEVKAQRQLTEEHLRQLRTNVHFLNKSRGLLLNFGQTKLDIRRYANDQHIDKKGA